jgi:hypothetical protein
MIEERCCYYIDSTNSAITSSLVPEERREKYWLPSDNFAGSLLVQQEKALTTQTFNQNDFDKILQTRFKGVDIFIQECHHICATTRGRV